MPGAAQVEAVKLAAESRTAAIEAELAHAKRDAAQASSALKSAAASWQSELDWQKAEVRTAAALRPPLAAPSPLSHIDLTTHRSDNAAVGGALGLEVTPLSGMPQVSRMKRDLERVESERERAREDAKRCAGLRPPMPPPSPDFCGSVPNARCGWRRGSYIAIGLLDPTAVTYFAGLRWRRRSWQTT